MLIDSQVHAYEANSPRRPWDTTPKWPTEVTGVQMVSEMDSLGVDGGILVSAFSLYGYDASYAIEVRNQFPDRFALVKPIDPDDPSVPEIVSEWKRTPGAVGVRIMMPKDPISPLQRMGVNDSGLDLICREALRNDLPVNILCWDNLDAGFAVIDRNPDTRFIIDHMGILQPMAGQVSNKPWSELPKVLELASRRNATIKVSGACTLSKEAYPFSDIWDPLAQIFDAWGLERCLWGSDWTRTFALVDYKQAVGPFQMTDRLTKAEKGELMGGACAKAYGWKPQKA